MGWAVKGSHNIQKLSFQIRIICGSVEMLFDVVYFPSNAGSIGYLLSTLKILNQSFVVLKIHISQQRTF